MTPHSKTLHVIGTALRRLPAGMRGKARVARAILREHLSARDVSVQCRDGHRFMLPSLSDSVGFHLFIDGVYEPDEVGWVLSRVGPGDVFVDVGANIGIFSITVAPRVTSSGRVIAVEASPTVARYLDGNIALNKLSNITMCETVVQATSGGVVPFYEAPIERFGTGSLTPEYGGIATLVPAQCLDDLLREVGVARVKVLKIDVEGFEEGVLRGAEGLLRGSNPPAILFEFYDWAERNAGCAGDSQRLLREWGYRIWTLEGLLRNDAPIGESVTGVVEGSLIALREDQN